MLLEVVYVDVARLRQDILSFIGQLNPRDPTSRSTSRVAGVELLIEGLYAKLHDANVAVSVIMP